MKMNKITSLISGVLLVLVIIFFSGSGINKVEAYETDDGVWKYYDIGENEVGIYLYTGLETEVQIPDSIDGKKVAVIGELESVFDGCSEITSITIPQSVTSIRECAFSGCAGLTSITIPENVTSIGGNSFAGCKGLTSIVVEDGNKYYDSRENCNAIIEKSSNELIVGCKNTIIPANVTRIANGAFCGCDGLKSLTIPDSVTSIGENAFSGCEGLTSITIPENVTSIGGGAFYGCSDLTSIDIPSSVTRIDECTFMGCSSLISITIPSGLTEIGVSAFKNCENLREIVIPQSVTKIRDDAFSGCDKATIYVDKGSYAEEYLKDNNINYEYIAEPEDSSEKKDVSPSEQKTETPTVSPSKSDTVKTPGKAIITKAKNVKKKKLSVKWKKVTGAKGYEVQYSTNKKFKKTKTKNTTKTTLTIKKLKKKKTYYVRVRAYTLDSKGNKKYGKWSAVKKVKIKK